MEKEALELVERMQRRDKLIDAVLGKRSVVWWAFGATFGLLSVLFVAIMLLRCDPMLSVAICFSAWSMLLMAFHAYRDSLRRIDALMKLMEENLAVPSPSIGSPKRD